MLKRMFQTVESELKKYTTLNAPTLLEQMIKTHIFLTDFLECSCNTSAFSSKKTPSFSTRPETSCGAAFIVYTMMGGVDGETRGAIWTRFHKKLPEKSMKWNTSAESLHGTHFCGDGTWCKCCWLLPGKLTCPLKINGWKMYFLLK